MEKVKVVLEGVAINLSEEDAKHWGEVLTGLTADEVEAAQIERELEAAKIAGLITAWTFDSNPPDWKTSCGYTLRFGNPDENQWFGPTRLAAARAALEYVRGLPVPKPALPDVEGMSCHELALEMGRHGYFRLNQDLPCWKHATENYRDSLPMDIEGENYAQYMQRIVRRAREFAGE